MRKTSGKERYFTRRSHFYIVSGISVCCSYLLAEAFSASVVYQLSSLGRSLSASSALPPSSKKDIIQLVRKARAKRNVFWFCWCNQHDSLNNNNNNKMANLSFCKVVTALAVVAVIPLSEAVQKTHLWSRLTRDQSEFQRVKRYVDVLERPEAAEAVVNGKQQPRLSRPNRSLLSLMSDQEETTDSVQDDTNAKPPLINYVRRIFTQLKMFVLCFDYDFRIMRLLWRS